MLPLVKSMVKSILLGATELRLRDAPQSLIDATLHPLPLFGDVSWDDIKQSYIFEVAQVEYLKIDQNDVLEDTSTVPLLKDWRGTWKK